MTYVLVALLLGWLILIHEAGHFLAAKRAGVPVRIFSVGFGPALVSRTWKGTQYRVSAIPLGGYVLLGLEDENQYLSLPLRKRLAFSLGGPLANILVVPLLYALLNVLGGHFGWEAILIRPFVQTWQTLGHMVAAIGGLFSDTGSLSGLVGIVSEGGKFVGLSLVRAVRFGILLSLNLAVFNLLPFPPLDGGRIVLDLLQRLSSRLGRIYLPLTMGGWAALILLMLYATSLDIRRLLT